MRPCPRPRGTAPKSGWAGPCACAPLVIVKVALVGLAHLFAPEARHGHHPNVVGQALGGHKVGDAEVRAPLPLDLHLLVALLAQPVERRHRLRPGLIGVDLDVIAHGVGRIEPLKQSKGQCGGGGGGGGLRGASRPPEGSLGYCTCAQKAISKAQARTWVVSGLQDHRHLSKKIYAQKVTHPHPRPHEQLQKT